MKNKRTTGCLVAALAVMAGCARAPEQEICGQQQALRSEQGAQMNGIQTNATTNNGRYLNGRYLNGRFLNGGALQGRFLNGNLIESVGLLGATLQGRTSDGGTIPLTIAAVERDADDPELVYLSLVDPDGQNLCGAEGRGLFVQGIWDDTGARHDAGDEVTFSCTTGVIAKCVRWGYKPWRVGADLHQACTRMARADYCGDGVSHTENGTTIDVFDGQGIQVPATTAAEGFTFEAGWGPGGAVCAAHPRYRDVGRDGAARLPSCWDLLPVCQTQAQAQARGALIANASVETERQSCGL